MILQNGDIVPTIWELVVRQASVGLSIIGKKKISLVPESYALPTLRSCSNP